MAASNVDVSNFEIFMLTVTFLVILPLIFNILILLIHYFSEPQTSSMASGINDDTHATNPASHRRYFQRIKNFFSVLFEWICRQNITDIVSVMQTLWAYNTGDLNEENTNETGLLPGHQQSSGQENPRNSILHTANSSTAIGSNEHQQQNNESRNSAETFQDQSSEQETQHSRRSRAIHGGQRSTSMTHSELCVNWFGDDIERKRLARGENLTEYERHGRSKYFLNAPPFHL